MLKSKALLSIIFLFSIPMAAEAAEVISMWNTPTMHCWTTADEVTHCKPRTYYPPGPVVGDAWNTPTMHCWIDGNGVQQCVPRRYPALPPRVISSWNTPTMHCWVESNTGTHCQPRRW